MRQSEQKGNVRILLYLLQQWQSTKNVINIAGFCQSAATRYGSSWGEFKVPFVFATNGREFLEQLRTKSGIWFCDLGFSETNLQVAWRETTNEDIAASIIGFIRQAALGDALVPYGDRVDKAMKKILASCNWTAPQRKWLERISQQLKTEVIVDRDAFDRGAFKAQGGGFERLNKAFNGRLEEILVEINAALWQDVG